LYQYILKIFKPTKRFGNKFYLKDEWKSNFPYNVFQVFNGTGKTTPFRSIFKKEYTHAYLFSGSNVEVKDIKNLV